MNRRVAVWLIAAGVLAVLVVWFANHTYWGTVEIPIPLKGEAARNPFYAAQRFAEALGAHTRWDRTLASPDPNDVVVASGWSWDLTAARRERMKRWVESGGRLVVDRTLILGSDDFGNWSGIHAVPLQPARARTIPGSLPEPRTPPHPCRDFAPIRMAAVAAPRHYTICNVDTATALRADRKPTWGLRDMQRGGRPIEALRLNVGRGSVTYINASPFLGRDLLESDHARLLVAAAQLRAGDFVHFLSEGEQLGLPRLIWRYGSPVVELLLALAAFAIWRGAVRFGPLVPPPEAARRSLAEQILGTGRFTRRVGGGRSLQAAVRRALDEAATRRIPSYGRLGPAERAERLAAATGLEGSKLEAAMAEGMKHRGAALASAIALLETARRRILHVDTRSTSGTTRS